MIKNIIGKVYISLCTQRNLPVSYENEIDWVRTIEEEGVIQGRVTLQEGESSALFAVVTESYDYLGRTYIGTLSMLYTIYTTRGYDFQLGRELFMDLIRDVFFEAFDDEFYTNYIPSKMVICKSDTLTADDMWEFIFELSAFAMYKYISTSSLLKKVLFKERDDSLFFELQGVEYSLPMPEHVGLVYEVFNLPYTSLFICKKGYHLLLLDIANQKSLGYEYTWLGNM